MRTVLVALAMAVLLPAVAGAVPAVQLQYVETPLGGGVFQYDYTFSNTSDPIADAGVDLYDVFLALPAGTLNVLSTPAGWDQISGAGFIDTFSLTPGEPPAGTDIAPGGSLGGLSFTIDSAVGPLAFEGTLSNPDDPGNPVLVDGTSAPAAVSVPAPSASFLLVLGGLGLALMSRRLRTS